MSDVPITTRQLNLAYDTIVKAGYVGLADQVLATITDLQAQNARLREALMETHVALALPDCDRVKRANKIINAALTEAKP